MPSDERYLAAAVKRKLVLWILLCIAIFAAFLWESRGYRRQVFHPSHISTDVAFSWAILVLCLIWLSLKRKEIFKKMTTARVRRLQVILGLTLIGLSLALYGVEELLIFRILLALLGAFTLYFGEAATTPFILLGIYSFASVAPAVGSKLAGGQYAAVMTSIAATILAVSGYPVGHQGQVIDISPLSGDHISIFIHAGCAGHYTMGIFVALFALMMMDSRLPPRKAGYLFFLGIVGTWLQNILRLIILILAGYYYGGQALWAVHNYTSYIIFPLWYALFAYIYLWQWGKERRANIPAVE